MSNIEWTDATWNPVVGCRRVSPGCEHCYAETMAGRLAHMGQRRYLDVVKLDDKGLPRGRWNGTFREVPEQLAAPLRWRKPRRVFVNSMSDLFGEGVSDEWIAAVFGVMAATPQHTYQILTKRAERMAQWFADEKSYDIPQAACAALDRIGFERGCGSAFDPDAWPIPNVHIGVSVEDQPRADERIPHLLRVPAAVRFLSVEPMLGPVDLTRVLLKKSPDLGADVTFDALQGWYGGAEQGKRTSISWVIVGGESGPGARPCDVAWIRSIVAQCKAAGVPCFVKQLGARPTCGDCGDTGIDDDDLCPKCAWFERDARSGRITLGDRKGGNWDEWPEDLRVREWPVTP